LGNQNGDLAPFSQAIVDPAVEIVRDLPIAGSLHELDDGTGCSVGGPIGFRYTESAGLHCSTGLQERSDADENADRSLHARALERHPASIETRSPIFLVGSMVLFVDHQQPKLRGGNQNAAAATCTEAMTRRHTQPRRSSLLLNLPAVESKTVGEPLL
jgi:hypothetical protein